MKIVITIGSDCVGITSDHILNAVAALDNSDMVLGPVHDGGYYLFGIVGMILAIAQIPTYALVLNKKSNWKYYILGTNCIAVIIELNINNGTF